ncbi:MAG: signal recognition particle protein [Dehalococcoidia bacterium]|nr:signal recognition particle protein [Dehalococcoidia bacterium]
MFDRLSERLDAALKRVTRRGVVREPDVDEALREVRRALLEADVNFRVVKEFTAAVREAALGEKVLQSVTPGQLVIKIVHDELTKLLGSESVDLTRSTDGPTVVLVVGLQGSGKTTSAAKLALQLQKRGEKPLLAAADTKRPAAVEQLVTLGDQIGVPIHREGSESKVEHIARNAVDKARTAGQSFVVIDTAGRLQIDGEMMDEIQRLSKRVKPHEVLFVADAMTGQEAVAVATEFNQRVPLTGLVLTKLDGDARGGAALSIRSVTGVPIKFMTSTEQLEPLEVFHPDRLASRILGMGDVVTLVEQAQEVIDEESALELEEKIRKASFGLDDFLEQLEQVKKMGPLSRVLDMVPGMGKLAQNRDVKDALEGDQMSRITAIILSMTPYERAHPELIDGSRRRRIAAGSGTTAQDVNQLLNQFREMREMMKALAGGKLPGMPGQFGGIPGF